MKRKPRYLRARESDRTFDDVRALIADAVEDKFGSASMPGSLCYCYVVDLTDTWVVFEIEGGDTDGLWKADYTLADDGTVTFGTPAKVQRITQYASSSETTERVEAGRVLEAVEQTDDDAKASGRVFEVRIIEFGISKNGKVYKPDVVGAAAPLYEGAKAFDHHRSMEELNLGSTTGLIGSYRNVHATESGLDGELHLLPGATRIAEALDASLSASAAGLPPLVGISHDVVTKQQQVDIGGRRLTEVTQIAAVLSADVVSDPSAGGLATRTVAGGLGDIPKGHDMTLKQLLALLREADSAKRAELLTEHKAVLDDNGMTADDVNKVLAEPVAPAVTDDKKTTTDAATDDDKVLVTAGAAQEAVYHRDSIVGRGLVRDAIAEAKMPDRVVEAVTSQLPERFTEAQLTDRVAMARAFGADVPAPTVPHIEVTRENVDALRDKLERTIEGGNQRDTFTGVKQAFVQIQRACGTDVDPLDGELPFQILRETYIGLPRMGVRTTESMTSASWSNVLADVMHKRLIAEYNVPNLQSWRQLVTTASYPDFRSQKLIRIGGYGTLPTVAEGAPYQALTSPADEEATNSVAKKGGTEDWTLEQAANDDLRALQRIPRALGRAAAQTLYRAIFDILVNNPAIYDGVTLFHASSHGANLISGTLSHASLITATKTMMKQAAFGNSVEVLGVTPKSLVVPADLFEIAFELTNSAVAIPATTPGPTDVPNYFRGMTPIVVPYWTDTNDWVAVADPADIPTMEVGFYQNQQDPELFVQDDPRVGSAFTADKVTMKIRHIWGVAVEDFRGFVKSVN